MKIIKNLQNDRHAIKCGFCGGSGSFPTSENQDETFDENCSVCGGKGFNVESGDPHNITDCKRCSGTGKKYDEGHFLGSTCSVCGGKGYVIVGVQLNSEFWNLLHPAVVKASRALFEGKNYTEALYRPIKELNTEMKEYYRQNKGEELDGHTLVGKLLSIDSPILQVADIETESGKNRQKGLMQLMQGLFVGVRNPISHDQTIGRNYCIHILFLLSFIHHQLDYSQMRKN